MSKKNSNKNRRLTVKIEDGCVVIRIGIGTLAFAANNCDRFHDGEHYGYEVTDESKFAREVVGALNAEQEDGTTPVHILLDNAFEYVVGDGGEGIEPKEIEQ